LSISDTSDTNSFEFTAVKLLYCSLKVCSSLKLNKASFAIPVTTSLGVDDIEAGLTSEVFQVLPAGLTWKSRYLHAMRSTSWTWSIALCIGEGITGARTTSKLNGQALTHEVRAMEGGNYIAGIHRIFVFNESEAIHKLDLGDFSSAMSVEVRLDIGFGSTSRKIAQVQPGGRYLSHDEMRLLSRWLWGSTRA